MKPDHSSLHKTHSAILNGPGTKADKARALFAAGVTQKARISELLGGYSVGAIANALAVKGKASMRVNDLNPAPRIQVSTKSFRAKSKKDEPPKQIEMPNLLDSLEYYSRPNETAETMLRQQETKRRLLELDGTLNGALEFAARNLAKSKNYKPSTYYRIEGAGEGYAGVGNGLYLGRDAKALQSFYNPEQDRPQSTFMGSPKWLDLMDYDLYEAFQMRLERDGITLLNSTQLAGIVNKLGFDGIRYYDPFATGEEFVLFNTKKLKKIQ